MTATYSIAEVAETLDALIERVIAGEEILISRDGIALWKISPIGTPPSLSTDSSRDNS
jgi:antitoxin (DNA-binding transcriptional repressor) of toxin-antitoxin stability system